MLRDSQCVVIYVPPPTLSPTFENLIDSCVSEIGVTSTLLLTGTPPFVVHYESTQLSPKVSTQRPPLFILSRLRKLTLVPLQENPRSFSNRATNSRSSRLHRETGNIGSSSWRINITRTSFCRDRTTTLDDKQSTASVEQSGPNRRRW